MYKIAFLFLTIDNPHFPKLWDSYFRGNKEKYTLYIHPKNREKVTWKSKNIIKNLQETEWGFIVHAYIELFRAAYQDPENQKFVTISESDVPIQSFSKFYDDSMSDGRSWIKFKKIKNYNWKERINKQPKKDRPKHFIKHLARFCLNREHVKQLLEKNKEQQLEFFYHMHVGDEFFLSVLYPIHNVKNFAVTYDDWNYVNLELQKIKEKKKQLYELQEKNGKNYSQSLKELQNNYNQIAKNPKSITNVRDDLQFIKQCPSYFYRKFTKKSNISDYWKEIIQAHN
jgi:hypothetical protein